ncbi:uncharacterized protein LOC123498707 isoform X2 [Portunus trituberculatus]|uniref:uncharacterized protein LOC123498707 isoform X2 n=1 Tax=Portunus trituberculatus TaxID=210409 RepID=UPI001E1CF903|nr:uncharacterized protein LOC123498707 isoform X2 [Portunus trituberculatus]XP_045102036.1 uncharacterized protein LOC123498707 isoform X2 [Portunus trituberculatus]
MVLTRRSGCTTGGCGWSTWSVGIINVKVHVDEGDGTAAVAPSPETPPWHPPQRHTPGQCSDLPSPPPLRCTDGILYSCCCYYQDC